MRKLLKRCRPGFPIESLELRRLLAAVGFDGGGDGVNWNDPLNWSNNALPTSNDDVTLAPGGEVIQPLNVSLSVKSIQANRPLKVAQAFSIAESAIFNSALTLGSTSGSPGLFVGGDLTTNGTVTIARSASINFILPHDHLWSGSALVSGANSLAINNNATFYDSQTQTSYGFNATIEPGISFNTNSVTIKPGAASGGSFDSFASMSVSGGSARTITVSAEPGTMFTNHAAWSATAGATIKLLATTWRNTGTITISASALTLGGSFTTSGIGTIHRTDGTVELTGSLDNTGATLALSDSTGIWIQRNTGIIIGGHITTSGFVYLLSLGGIWSNVTLDGNATVGQENELHVRNGLTVNGSLSLGFASQLGHLLFDGEVAQVVDGAGEIRLDTNPISSSCRIENQILDLATNTGRALTFAQSLIISMPRLTFLVSRNQGVINNYATISAHGSEAGFYVIGPSQTAWTAYFNNYGTIAVVDANVEFEKVTWANYGTLALTDCDFEMNANATVTEIGNLQNISGTWRLSGVLDNTNSSFTLSPITGDLRINGGTIIGGIINSTGTTKIISEHGNFNNVTLNAPLEIPDDFSLNIFGNFTLNSTIRMKGSFLVFEDSTDQLFNGSGTVISETTFLYDVIKNDTDEGDTTTKTLTIASGLHFSGNDLYISIDAYAPAITRNYASFNINGSSDRLTFNSSDSEGDGRIFNYGTLNISNGATLNFEAMAWHNLGVINLNNATFNMGGRFNSSDYGVVNRQSSIVNIVGRMENTNETTVLNVDTGNWVIKGGRIVGGVIDTDESYTFLSTNGVLDGVTVEGLITLVGSTLWVDRGMTLNGQIKMGDFTIGTGGGSVNFRGETDQTLAGTGSIFTTNFYEGNVQNFTRNQATNRGQRLNIGADIEITGQNVTVSNNSSQDATVVNYGTIGSNHANGLVKFGTWWDGTRVINRGHIYATNSADLDIYNARESLGWVELRGEGSSGYVSGEFDLGGNIAITGGAIMKFVGAVNGPAAIDLEGSIIFDYPTEALSPVADVGAMISSGYANGAWNGPGIRSSFAATHPKYAVGFADAFALYEGGGTITTAALSIAFDETSVLARTTLKGDANLDLTVNFNDLLPIAQNYGATNSTWITGDFNYDGMTGFQDLLAAAQNYGSSALSLAPAGTFAAPSRRSEDSPRVDALLD